MKTHHTNTKLRLYLLSFFMVSFLVSCGTTQTITHNEDGIYTNNNIEQTQRRVVIANERESKEYNNNYFTKELQRLEDLNDSDIITDIDNYKSYNDDELEEIIREDSPQARIIYNEPWGYDNRDVVININTSFDYGYNPYWNNFYGYNYYGWNRWNRWNRWEYITPYHWNGSYYPPYRYKNYYRNIRRRTNPYRKRYSVSNSRRVYTNSRRSTSSTKPISTVRRNVYSTRGNRNNRGHSTSTRSTRNTHSRTIRNHNNGQTRSVRSTKNTRSYTTPKGERSSRTRATRSEKNIRPIQKRSSTRHSTRNYTPSTSSSRSYIPSRNSSSRSSRR